MNNAVEKIEQPTQAPITPARMLQVAVEQGADLDKIEKLMDLQERWEKSQAQKEYVAAMATFRAECPSIAKTKEGHNSKYAGLAESIDQIKVILAECGLSHSWKTEQDGNLVKITCTVRHIGGHEESTSLAAGPETSGSKNSIQAIGSTVTYLQRYTLFAILGLASQEMDTDGNTFDEGVSMAIDSLMAADSIDKLQTEFKNAWRKHTSANARKQLTATKDQRKKELS